MRGAPLLLIVAATAIACEPTGLGEVQTVELTLRMRLAGGRDVGATPGRIHVYTDSQPLPRAAAFPTQLFFLFQRARQLQQIRQQDLFDPVRVADYMLEKDRLFARLTLDDEEYSLYEQVYAKLAIDAPKPDLVVYLQAPVDVLMERIARRGIRYEQLIERSYLEKLADAYARFFLHYDASPLLIVNAASIDPVNIEAHYDMLFREISALRRGRQYFNPSE